MSQKIQGPPSGSAVVSCLYAMAFIVAALAVIATLFKVGMILSSHQQKDVAAEMIVIVWAGIGGVAAATLLGALAAVLGHLQAQGQMLHRLVRAQEDASTCLARLQASQGGAAAPPPPIETAVPVESAGPVTPWIDNARLEQVTDLLGEINENLLLTAEQRQAKRRQQLQQMHRSLCETLTSLLGAGKFVEAQARLDAHARLFPEDRRQLEECQAQIDEARARVEQSEYEQAAIRVRELMSTTAWDRADETVQDLLLRHPKSPRVRELFDAVRQDRTKFETQQRQHTLAQIEQLGTQRQWREAHRLAVELVSRFPDTPEAHTLQARLDTLKENAEIEIRRHLEEQFKELVKTHRYIEALALAQDVVAKYPGSPQAKVLREQMPQLMGKAKMQMDQAGGA